MPAVSALTLMMALVAGQPASEGHVTLPLIQWSQLLDGIYERSEPPSAPAPYTVLGRQLRGNFSKGMLAATLTVRFDVLDDQGYIEVPVLDASSSVQSVTLDGEPTSLIARGGTLRVGLAGPGDHEVSVRFLLGQEQDRFARRLSLSLPPGGVTAVAVTLPEADIQVELEGGALTGVQPVPGGTEVAGHVDIAGRFELTWRRHRPERVSGTRLEATVQTLIHLGEDLVRGTSAVTMHVRDGEANRFVLRLPDEALVLRVTGDAVLQWRTLPDDRQQIEVLTRYLVTDSARLVVHFQAPVQDAGAVPLSSVMPREGVAVDGSLGLVAPPGLDVSVGEATGATARPLRDLPSELTALTSQPLLEGFVFSEGPPRIAVALARHAEVPVTSTLIDEVQASSVLLGDGQQVTKVRLDIRNNTRQYLAVTLPVGGELTHALLDGHPVRPAAGDGELAGSILFSLRQSEKIDAGGARQHVVRPGESLGVIAHRYYADPERWPLIADANRGALGGGDTIRVGQRLVIPAAGDVTVEESAFVLEFAYRIPGGDGLGAVGEATLALPRFDVDAMKLVWHLYLPDDVDPLVFDTEMTQLDSRRYDLLRRFKDLFELIFPPSDAYAGGDYTGILSKRRQIYEERALEQGRAEVAPEAFPLVGTRYRFRQVLSDSEPARIGVVYLSDGLGDVARGVCFVLATFMAWLFVRRGARWWQRLIAAGSAPAFLFVAHYVLGVHRLLVWAAVVALVLALAGLARRHPWKLRWDQPWRGLEGVRLGHVVAGAGLLYVGRFVVDHPGTVSLVLLAVLGVWWRVWSVRAVRSEVTHA